MVGGPFPGRIYFDDLIVLDFQDDLAADTAVGTGCLYAFDLPGSAFSHGNFGPQRRSGADSNTAAAEFTRTIRHVAVCTETDVSAETTVEHTDGFYAIDITAGAHAPAAKNTLVTVNLDEWVGVVDRIMMLGALVAISLNAVFVSQILQQAVPSGLACHTIQGVIGDQEFQGKLTRSSHSGCIGMHHQSIRDRESAGRL